MYSCKCTESKSGDHPVKRLLTSDGKSFGKFYRCCNVKILGSPESKVLLMQLFDIFGNINIHTVLRNQ